MVICSSVDDILYLDDYIISPTKADFPEDFFDLIGENYMKIYK